MIHHEIKHLGNLEVCLHFAEIRFQKTHMCCHMKKIRWLSSSFYLGEFMPQRNIRFVTK